MSYWNSSLDAKLRSQVFESRGRQCRSQTRGPEGRGRGSVIWGLLSSMVVGGCVWPLEASGRARDLPASYPGQELVFLSDSWQVQLWPDGCLRATGCDFRVHHLLYRVGMVPCEGPRETPEGILPLPWSSATWHKFLKLPGLYSPCLWNGDSNTFLTGFLKIRGDRRQNSWRVVSPSQQQPWWWWWKFHTPGASLPCAVEGPDVGFHGCHSQADAVCVSRHSKPFPQADFHFQECQWQTTQAPGGWRGETGGGAEGELGWENTLWQPWEIASGVGVFEHLLKSSSRPGRSCGFSQK